MGAGNYTKERGDIPWEMVYVDTVDLEELTHHVRDALPASFVNSHRYDGNELTIAENELIEVRAVEWGIYIVVIVMAKEYQTCGLAERHISTLAPRLFDALSDKYDIYIRTGPWTSTRRVK